MDGDPGESVRREVERLTQYDTYPVPLASIYYDTTFNCRGNFTLQSVEELAASIRLRGGGVELKGLDYPIVVQPIEDMVGARPAGFAYRLIAGHRRFKAMEGFLRWSQAPAMIRAGLSDHEARMLNFVENLERKDLNPLEEARALARLYQYLNHDGYECDVVPMHPGWRWWIRGQVEIWSDATYDTCENARRAIFDYLETSRLLGDMPTSPQVFSLTGALEEIERICTAWSDEFTRRSSEWHVLDFDRIFGPVRCSVHQRPCDGQFWELFLILPDRELGARRYDGSHATWTNAWDAKIEALEIFRREMTRLAYEHTALEPEPPPLPPNDIERRQVKDAHDRAEAQHAARFEAAQREAAETQRRRLVQEQYRASETLRRERLEKQRRQEAEDKRQRDEDARREAAETRKQEVVFYRKLLRSLPDPLQRLQDAIDNLPGVWSEKFNMLRTGSLQAQFEIESIPASCTIWSQDGKWRVGVFAPFDYLYPWRLRYDTVDDAIDASRGVFRIKMLEWAQRVLGSGQTRFL